jgi:CheY-like chemotaxis protein
VLSTLHATDAIATVSRLLALDISSDLIASSLFMVIAQRLIRRICLQCRKEYQPDGEELQRIGLGNKMPELTFYKGEGCKICRNTGYYGQIGIFEIFMPSEFLRQKIAKGTGTYDLKRLAIEAGMKTMRENGLEKIRQGLTTLEEVSRVCPMDRALPQKPESGKTDNQVVVSPDSKAAEALVQPKESDSVVLLLEEEIQEKTPCIVVAEDDPSVRRVLQTLLRHKGYQVISAVDGEEALQKIRIAKPDLVILDINMPKKDGFSVCEDLRASVQTAFISVIMLTAQSAIESKVRGLAVGADDYMTKPFHPEELLARIDAILRRSS